MNAHVVRYAPRRGMVVGPAAYCLTCKWVCAGAVEAVREAVARHEGRPSNPSDGGGAEVVPRTVGQ